MSDHPRKNAPDGRELSRQHLIVDLLEMGVNEGDHLALGVSFASIGLVKGGPNTLIDALLDVVGPGGTLIVPTYSQTFHLRRGKLRRLDFIFDPASTPSYTGLIAETIRTRKGAMRSRHPSNSMAAIGKEAGFLTKSHDETAGAYSPYSKLGQLGGRFLGIGVNDRLVGLRHQAQALAGLLNVLQPTHGVKYRDPDGRVRVFVRRDRGGCTKKLPGLVQPLRERGFITDGQIGMARSLLVPVRPALEAMTRMLEEDPTLNLCDDVACLWCREIERRMSLYPKIRHPVWFQVNGPARRLIAMTNALRISGWFPWRLGRLASRLIKLMETIKR